MSGGAWNYQQWRIEERAAEYAEDSQIRAFLMAVAKSERIVDWAVCGDTSPEDAARELYELWLATFEQVFAGY